MRSEESLFIGLGPIELAILLAVGLLLFRALFSRRGRSICAVFGVLAMMGFAVCSYIWLARSRVSDSSYSATRSERIRVSLNPRALAPRLEISTDEQVDAIPQLALAEPVPAPSGKTASSVAAKKPKAEVTNQIPLELDETETSGTLPGWVTDPAADEMVATVGPLATREECQRQMSREIDRVTNAYIDILMGRDGAGEIVDLPLEYIQDHIVQREDMIWQPVQSSVGPMLKMHARLRFSESVDSVIRKSYAQKREFAEQFDRVGETSAWAGLLLTVLATVWGYLKLDTATKGYYSGRLKLAAGTVILAAGTALVMLARN